MTYRPPAAACAECAAPLDGDQRYCLQCGARHGAARVDPLAALGYVLDAPAAPAPPTPARPRTPSRRAGAALAAATLIAGAVLGAALGPGPAPSAAAPASRPVIALVTAVAPAAPAAPVTATMPEPSAPAAVAPATPSTPGADTTAAAPAAPAPDTTPSSAAPPPTTTPATTTPTAPPPVTVPHVWLVTLSGLDAETAFGPASPLADLTAKGTLLRGYAPVAAAPAANQIALLGGQVPTADCAADLASCILAPSEPAVPTQLQDAGRTWRAYVEDPAARCSGPAEHVGVSLFHALADRADCAQHEAGLDALAADLATPAATPTLSLVTPAATADAAPLHALVAQITASRAYNDGGILILSVDSPPVGADPAALPAVGALVLSPRATAGRAIDTPTGPFALLRSLDGLLALTPVLGRAVQTPAGALDGVLAPATATAAAASTSPHRTHSSRRSN